MSPTGTITKRSTIDKFADLADLASIGEKMVAIVILRRAGDHLIRSLLASESRNLIAGSDLNRARDILRIAERAVFEETEKWVMDLRAGRRLTWETQELVRLAHESSEGTDYRCDNCGHELDF